MIIDRAIEILNSTDNIAVLHEGRPIWIESINTDSRKAIVRVVGTDQVEEVLVATLTDTGSRM
jgi:H-type small acid-soluble spore protein